MPTAIVPLKVKIGLRPNGHADYPAWERLPLIAQMLEPGFLREAVDAAVRQHVVGSWHYDKTAGHEVDTPDSPRGMQWGMLLVTRAFADQALVTFPSVVTVMTRTEVAAFWETKAYGHLPDEDLDAPILTALQSRRALMVARGVPPPALAALDTIIDRALDPLDSHPGVRRNPRRRWTDQPARLGIIFDPSVGP